MSPSILEIPAEVRALLDEHLDALERSLLAAGVSRQQRQAICEDVDVQMREMLSQRSATTPTVDQARAVIAEMDSPEEFLESLDLPGGGSVATNPDLEQRTHILAIFSAIVPILAVMTLFMSYSPTIEGRPPDDARTIVFLICAELLAVVLGVVAIRDIRQQPKRRTGLVLALLGILALPMVIGNVYAYTYFAPKAFQKVAGKSIGKVDGHPVALRRVNELTRELTLLQLEAEDPSLESNAEVLVNRSRRVRNCEIMIADINILLNQNPLTATDRWIAEHRKLIEFTVYSVVIGLSAAVSVLGFLAIYGRCQLGAELAGTDH